MMKEKRIVTYVLGFFMCLFLTLLAFGGGCWVGFLTDDSLNIAFSESKAFDAVREEVLDNINYANAPQGFDRLVAENVITKDLVRADLSTYIYVTYSGEVFEIDEEAFENNYYGSVSGTLAEKNIFIGKEDEPGVDSYFNELKAYYQQQLEQVDLSNFAWADNYALLAKTVTAIGGVGGLVCFVAIWIMVKNKKDRVQLYGFAGISAGILTMSFPTYMLAAAGYRNMQIGVEYLYNLTVTFIRNGFVNVSFCGGLVLAAGIGCAIADLVFMND